MCMRRCARSFSRKNSCGRSTDHQINRSPDLWRAPATAARRLNPHLRALFHAYAGLAWKGFASAIVMDDLGLSRRAISTALQSVWATAAAIGQQRDFRVGQQLKLAHDAIATAEFPAASASSAQRVLSNPQR